MKPPAASQGAPAMSVRGGKANTHRSAVDVLEEATTLLRNLPARSWLAFYGPSIPFVTYLIYHWSEMSQAPDAPRRLVPQTLLLALLYILMKCGHAVFGDHLLSRLRRDSQRPAALSPAMWFKLAASQGMLHATMPWMMVISSLPMLTGWSYGFYRNLSLLACGHLRAKGSTRTLIGRALHIAHHQPIANHALLCILGLVGLLVWFNALVLSFILPQLAGTLTGIDLEMNHSPLAMLNTTLFAGSIASAWLLMSPVFQAAYAVRCFEADSVKSGEDLLSGLRSLRGAAVSLIALLCLLMGSPCANAAEAVALDTQRSVQLDQEIEKTLDQAEFRWRLPRETIPESEMDWLERIVHDISTWLTDSIKTIVKWIEDFIDWLITQEEDPIEKAGRSNGSWLSNPDLARALIFILIIGLVLLLAVLLIRWIAARNRAGTTQATLAAPVIDLHDESIIASDLPEDEWLRLANEQLAMGNHRLAIRALFLGTLARLGSHQLLGITPGKTNGMYLRELNRRSRATPTLRGAFERSMRIFERCWYGTHSPTLETLEEVRAQHDLISHDARTSNP